MKMKSVKVNQILCHHINKHLKVTRSTLGTTLGLKVSNKKTANRNMLWATEFVIEFSTPNSKIALKIPCPSTVVLQPFWHQELVLWRQFFHGWGWGGSEGDGSGSNVSHGEWWRAADEVSFTGPLLTSCYTRQYWSTAWGWETSVLVYSFSLFNVMMAYLPHDCMCAKSLQLCLTLWDPSDCSLPGFSVHEIL